MIPPLVWWLLWPDQDELREVLQYCLECGTTLPALIVDAVTAVLDNAALERATEAAAGLALMTPSTTASLPGSADERRAKPGRGGRLTMD
jgi:hypothetical protein